MIRFLLFALTVAVLALAPAHADTRDVYTIKDIRVDERANSVIAAREKAMTSARLQGARTLINKITLASDRAAAGGVPIDVALADRLAAAVDVQEEVAGAGRYRGTLAVVFNPREVRALLDRLGIPYSDRQGPTALMIPIASSGLDYDWRAALGDSNRGALSPYVTSNIPVSSSGVTWEDVRGEVQSLRASRAITAELLGRDGAWRVRLKSITASGEDAIGTTRSQPTLEAAARAASAYLDNVWKQQSIVRSNTRTLRSATVRFTSLSEWNKLRGALARSPLVSEFKTEAIARDGAIVRFAYAGDQAGLNRDLRQRGVALENDPTGWILHSAVSRR